MARPSPAAPIRQPSAANPIRRLSSAQRSTIPAQSVAQLSPAQIVLQFKEDDVSGPAGPIEDASQGGSETQKIPDSDEDKNDTMWSPEDEDDDWVEIDFQFRDGDYCLDQMKDQDRPDSDEDEDEALERGMESGEMPDSLGRLPRSLGTFVNPNVRPGTDDKIPRNALHVFNNDKEVEDKLEEFQFSMPLQPPMTHQKPAIAWMMQVESNDVADRRFGCKKGLLGDDVGLGKTYDALAVMYNMDKGHTDRLTIITW